MASSTFRHKPPSQPVLFALGVFMYCVMQPLVRITEWFGKTDRMFNLMGKGRVRQFEKNNPFRGYTPGPQDVFVMTYAKSGTNWMMQIVHQLIYHGKGEFNHIHDLVPWPDAMGPLKNYAIPLDQATHWKTAPEKLRVIKTHFDWGMLPYSPEARYIAVIRDPKDVFVSNYFFIGQVFDRAMPTVDTWYKLFLGNYFVPNGCWAENAAGYWAQRHRPNVLVMSFKAMKRDLPGSIRKAVDFLGLHPSEEVLKEVERQSTFQYMKSIDHKFSMGKMVPWREAGSMIRKGTQGGSSELLTPERQREVDAHFIAKLKALGSDLPYEEFADLAR